MPRGRPRKKPIEGDIIKSTSGIQPEETSPITTKRGRKSTPKDIPTCECCGAPLTSPGLYKAKFNQILGTGTYRFKAANVSPDMCENCWKDLLNTVDKWFLSHGIPEKFKDGLGHVVTETSTGSINTLTETTIEEDI